MERSMPPPENPCMTSAIFFSNHPPPLRARLRRTGILAGERGRGRVHQAPVRDRCGINDWPSRRRDQRLGVDPPQFPVTQLVDRVRDFEERGPVGDSEHGHIARDALDRVADNGLVFRVEGAGDLVENENARLPDDGSRQRDALTLATGEAHASLAEDGVDPLLPLADEVVGFRLPQRFLHHFHGDVRIAKSNIRQNRIVIKAGILRHIADEAAPASGRCRRRGCRRS